MQKVGYVDVEDVEEKKRNEWTKMKPGMKAMEINIEKIYEDKAEKQMSKKNKMRGIKQEAENLNRKKAKVPRGEQFELEEEETMNNEENNNAMASEKKKSAISSILKKKWFDKPIFQDLLETSTNNFKNPLKYQNAEMVENLEEDDENYSENKTLRQKQAQKDAKTQEDIDSEEESNKYLINVPLSEMEKRRRRLKRQRSKDAKKDPVKDNEFEVVETNHKFEDYDIDTAAETLALAKKMLRKKDREAILESTYSKYAFEDQDDAPKWFREDEMCHNHLILPITKDEFQAEKQRLLAINSRTPKKVMEAKIRNFKRAAKKMKRTKVKAEQIFDQEGVTEGIKARQIRNLYKKEVASLKKKKKYVVGRRGNAGPGKNSRSMKFVDARCRKDRRRDKDAPKDGKQGPQKKIRKVKGNKKFNRRKRK